MKVLFIASGGPQRPSTRLRILQFLPFLEKNGLSCSIFYFKKKCIIRLLLLLRSYDVIVIQKIIFPIWFFNLLSQFNSKIIFDFDDAIYVNHPQCNIDEKSLKLRRKRLRVILSKVKAVIVGNHILADYAKKYNPRCFILPTIPPKNGHESAHAKGENIVIGWIGTKNNLIYLKALNRVFEYIGAKYSEKIILKIVSDGKFSCEKIKVDNKKWKLEEENQDLSSFDIGIMPLTDDEYSRGKCAFKILQYMRFGIPVVASPVGINDQILNVSQGGFLAKTPEEWIEKLSLLIENSALRKKLGTNGKNFVNNQFDTDAIAKEIISIIRFVANNIS